MPYGYNVSNVEEKKMSKHAKRRANKRAKQEAAGITEQDMAGGDLNPNEEILDAPQK